MWPVGAVLIVLKRFRAQISSGRDEMLPPFNYFLISSAERVDMY
jgi:hypothetical protein